MDDSWVFRCSPPGSGAGPWLAAARDDLAEALRHLMRARTVEWVSDLAGIYEGLADDLWRMAVALDHRITHADRQVRAALTPG